MKRDLTTNETAKALDLTYQTIRNYISKGCPCDCNQKGMNKDYRFNEQEVRDWLKESKRGNNDSK
jgi:phage terminase Nu1 subunit (DNA packaging protein)